VNPPDPAWHFSGRSQSAAWTALNGPYRDAVLDDRSDEAAEIMATEIAPDFEYVGRRSTRGCGSWFEWRADRPTWYREAVEYGGIAITYEEWDAIGRRNHRRLRNLIEWLAWSDVPDRDEWRTFQQDTWWQRFEFTDPEMFGGFDGIDRSIALDSDLHPPRIGERRRMLPSGRLPYGLVLEGMAPRQPTRFEFTDPDQGFDLERRADGWHVVQTVRVGGSLVVSAVDSPRGTVTLESPRQHSVPYRPRWASRLAATFAEAWNA
jgi:hypothetical protein